MRSVEPLTIESAASDKRVQHLPTRLDFHIGSYLGIPVRCTDGTLYGTLCVLDPKPHRFTANDLDLLTIMSGWVRLYLEREASLSTDG